MNPAGSLSLQGTTLTVALSILALAATAALGLIAWRRSGRSRSIAALELLRLAIVAGVAFLFNQPEWVQPLPPAGKPTVAVLWDDSLSMTTRDAVTPGGAGGLISRRESVAPLTDPQFWAGLSGDYDLAVGPLSSAGVALDGGAGGEPPRQGGPRPGVGATDLHRPLAAALERHSPLAAVVLVSDGDWNTGEPPVEAATLLRLNQTPVFTMLAGSATRLPDTEVVEINPPAFGVAGKSVRVPFTIESSLPGDHVTTVRLRVSTGETITKQVRVPARGRASDAIVWRPRSTGDYTLTLTAPPHADEQIVANNSREAPITIREEKLRVLVIESSPRWEYRYLRNALSRDPGVEVSCLLFHPGLPKRGGGNADYLKEFPAKFEELTKYDVVFLGDVGVEAGQLTDEQCERIRGLVERQASGLVLMPGWQGRQFTLLDTELAGLFPVRLDPSRPEGWGSPTVGQFRLTESGQRSLLTKLADTPQTNAEVWRRLPGFQWHAPVLRARAGSDVLAVHETATNQHGRLPLLATRTSGAGKVLFMGTDGAWRWRRGVEDKYHYRFWGQVVRWMAYQRNMAKGESMRLYYWPDQPRTGQTLTLNANISTPSGEPVSGGEVVAQIIAPSGMVRTVRFKPLDGEWGAFAGEFSPAEPGRHRVTLASEAAGASLDASFFVQGDPAEKVGRPARPEVLREIAQVSRGEMIPIENARDAIERLASLPPPPPTLHRIPLWSHPGGAALLVVALGLFWRFRKQAGLF